MKKLLAIAGAILCSSVVAVRAQTVDPSSVVAAYDTAANAHDVDAAVDLFAHDAVVIVQSHPFIGKDEIRVWLRQTAANNFRAELIGERQVAGDTVTWRARFWRDDLVALDVTPLEAHAEAVVQDGKIKMLTSSLTPESALRLQTALATPGRRTASAPIGLLLPAFALAVMLLAAGLAVWCLRRQAMYL